jgi:hypothetical protein
LHNQVDISKRFYQNKYSYSEEEETIEEEFFCENVENSFLFIQTHNIQKERNIIYLYVFDIF